MEIDYLLVPFLAWLVAGSLKFVINSAKAGTFALSQIGYGGLPSNHSAIVTATTTLIGLKESIEAPAFAVAITLAFIVILDASSLRKQIGFQAQAINQLRGDLVPRLRQRIGHERIEIAAGVLVGASVAFCLHFFWPRFLVFFH